MLDELPRSVKNILGITVGEEVQRTLKQAAELKQPDYSVSLRDFEAGHDELMSQLVSIQIELQHEEVKALRAESRLRLIVIVFGLLFFGSSLLWIFGSTPPGAVAISLVALFCVLAVSITFFFRVRTVAERCDLARGAVTSRVQGFTERLTHRSKLI